MKRRDFFTAAGAAILSPRLSWATTSQELIAEPVTAQILPNDSPASAMLGYNGSTPGPELRLSPGEFLDVRFLNQINPGSAVHWHGIRADNAMHGVPGLTQATFRTGDHFHYHSHAPTAAPFV